MFRYADNFLLKNKTEKIKGGIFNKKNINNFSNFGRAPCFF